jgi:pseudouridine-5'-phosphate glycosidase
VAHRIDDALAASRVVREQLARGAGIVIAVPIAARDALERREAESQVARALEAAEREGVRGAALTPFLLRTVSDATSGRSFEANVSLLRQNARVAAQIALALSL